MLIMWAEKRLQGPRVSKEGQRVLKLKKKDVVNSKSGAKLVLDEKDLVVVAITSKEVVNEMVSPNRVWPIKEFKDQVKSYR